MSPLAMRERLRFLYGEPTADDAYEALQLLTDRFRPQLKRHPGVDDPFDESDALLITYGDTFEAPGKRPLQALGDFAGRHLRGRLSGIHLLPFFPYSSDYGFAVRDYLTVDPRLGDWDDVAALKPGFKLMFDFVLNHVSAESSWFRGFLDGKPPYDRFFISVDPDVDLSAVVRPRTTPLLTRFETTGGQRWVWTTFGPDQVDLDYSNPDVLLRMVEVMLTYVARGADLLRLDAVGYLWKQVGTPCIHLPQAHEVVKLFREVLDEVAPKVALVTETNVPHAENVSYFGSGRDEAQMVYQFPLAPLVLDAFARADARKLATWAAGLTLPSPRTAFFNFLASHDGIGVVPAAGILNEQEVGALVERVRAHGGEVSYRANPGGGQSPYELNSTFFDALSDPADSEPWDLKRDRFLCAHAIMLALAGVPGIYVHSLFGSHNDHEAYRRSGWKRDLNHERLQLDQIETSLAARDSETAQVFNGLMRLLERRRSLPALHPGSPQQVLELGPKIFGLRRGPRAGQTIDALHNLSAGPQEVVRPDGSRVRLAPYEAAWLEA